MEMCRRFHKIIYAHQNESGLQIERLHKAIGLNERSRGEFAMIDANKAPRDDWMQLKL